MAKPVEAVDGEVRKTLNDMLETMYHADGIGLGATQVDIHKRMIVMDVEQGKDGAPGVPYKLVNPEIIDVSDEENLYKEGCLSVPGIYDDIERPKTCRVKYLDENGAEQILDADGLLATCVQHEIDHLNGIVFYDHLSRLKKDVTVRKLKKARKSGQLEELKYDYK